VRRNVPYGDAPRNTLDIYLPDAPPQVRARAAPRTGCPGHAKKAFCVPAHAPRQGAPPAEPAPVVIFVTGGMWIIGYKAWGALLASRLRSAGCVVAALDYRNFPQGSVGDMTEDVSAGVGWVLRNAKDWGGDPRRCAKQPHQPRLFRDVALIAVCWPALCHRSVTLVGQSAGAHLCALALLYQSQRCDSWQMLCLLRSADAPHLSALQRAERCEPARHLLAGRLAARCAMFALTV